MKVWDNRRAVACSKLWGGGGGAVEELDLFHTHNLDLPIVKMYTGSVYIVKRRVRRITLTMSFKPYFFSTVKFV